MYSYIVSIDMGGSNVKAIIMKMGRDNATFVDSILIHSIDKNTNEENIHKFLTKNNVTLNQIEKFILVGSGSSYYEDTFMGVSALKIDEFSAIGMGGTILSKKDEALIVNVGTGTTIVYSNININKYLIGTGLGGGTFYGMSKRFGIECDTVNELFDLCENGDCKNVDLIIGDISKNDISLLSKDITAANFAGYKKNATNADLLSAILNLITQNIGLITKLAKENFCLSNNKKDIDIVFAGSFISNDVAKKSFLFIENFTKQKYHYIDKNYAPFVTAIGAYEYYLIKMREDKS